MNWSPTSPSATTQCLLQIDQYDRNIKQHLRQTDGQRSEDLRPAGHQLEAKLPKRLSQG